MPIGTSPRRLFEIKPRTRPSLTPTPDIANVCAAQIIRVGSQLDEPRAWGECQPCGEYYALDAYPVNLPGLTEAVISPFGLHCLVYHRPELPRDMLERFLAAANRLLATGIQPLAPEPSVVLIARDEARRRQAIRILHFLRGQTNNPMRAAGLIGHLWEAESQPSPENQIGWLPLDPVEVAAASLYRRAYPGSPVPDRDGLIDGLNTWVQQLPKEVVVSEVQSAITAALFSLGSAP